MKVLTLVPVSVAPPPCGEVENSKEEGIKRKGAQGPDHTPPTPQYFQKIYSLFVSYQPVWAAAVPLAALVAALHPLNQTWLVLHPSRR